MPKKVRSAKGISVDFDLLKIKQQIATGPAPVNVSEREEFVDKKIRRRTRKQKVSPTKLDVNVEPTSDDTETAEEKDVVQNVLEPQPEPNAVVEKKARPKKKPK